MTRLDLRDDSLFSFSMGGGEAACYVAAYRTERVAKAVFVGAAPPNLYESADNPYGGRDDPMVAQFHSGVTADRIAFLDNFTTGFFSAGGKLLVSEAQRVYARGIAAFASPEGTLDCIGAFSTAGFRADLAKFKLPALVIQSDSDALMPFEFSGARTQKDIPGSQVSSIECAPHGFNLSRAAKFNQSLLKFLAVENLG